MKHKGKSQDPKATEKEKHFNLYFSGANRDYAFRISKKVNDYSSPVRQSRRSNSKRPAEIKSVVDIPTDPSVNKWKLRANTQKVNAFQGTFPTEDLTRTEPIKLTHLTKAGSETDNHDNTLQSTDFAKNQSLVTKSTENNTKCTNTNQLYDDLLKKLELLKNDKEAILNLTQIVNNRLEERERNNVISSTTAEQRTPKAEMRKSKMDAKIGLLIDNLEFMRENISTLMSKKQSRIFDLKNNAKNEDTSIIDDFEGKTNGETEKSTS